MSQLSAQVGVAHPINASIGTKPPETPQNFHLETAQLILSGSSTVEFPTPHKFSKHGNRPETTPSHVQKVGQSALGLNPSNSNFEALLTLIAIGLVSEQDVILDQSGKSDLVATHNSIKMQGNLIALFNLRIISIFGRLDKQDGDKELVIALLTYGADPNIKWGLFERSVLHYAVKRGYKDIVNVLLDNGSNIGAKDNDGQTPLHLAVANGRNDIALLLLDKGANIEAKDIRGQTPLHLAAFWGNKDVAVLLLEWKASINSKDDDGKTPLHLAAGGGRNDAAALLLENGAKIDAKDIDDKTPLYWAFFFGKKNMAILLLEKGANFAEIAEFITSVLDFYKVTMSN
ncbi:MAG: ankyrin repeat domain-containing protein [Chlamydiales bacterium]|nr:ankyrin repeat domain-containing protein [Chlamydiales bacterium]